MAYQVTRTEKYRMIQKEKASRDAQTYYMAADYNNDCWRISRNGKVKYTLRGTEEQAIVALSEANKRLQPKEF